MMPVSMVTDTRLKGLKEILPIGLEIGSNEGDSLRKRIKLREGQEDLGDIDQRSATGRLNHEKNNPSYS